MDTTKVYDLLRQIEQRDNRIDELEDELSDIKNWAVIVMPSYKGHAQSMSLVASKWLKDNT